MTQVVTFPRTLLDDNRVLAFGTHGTLPKPEFGRNKNADDEYSAGHQDTPRPTSSDDDMMALSFLAGALGIPFSAEILHGIEILEEMEDSTIKNKIGNSNVEIVTHDPSRSLRPDAFKPAISKDGNGIVFFDAERKKIKTANDSRKKLII